MNDVRARIARLNTVAVRICGARACRVATELVSWLCAFWLVAPLPLVAQHSVQWTTNYYRVDGEDLREIRRSMRQNRPWKSRHEVDAFTDWKVEWRYQTAPSDGGCRVTGFGTKTIILVTLPRWHAPTNGVVSEGTSNAWHRYIRALGQHEAGHVGIAMGAASEMAKRAVAMPVSSDCGTLAGALNSMGEQVLHEYRERERAYDERTRHGLEQGAALGMPPPRDRER